MATPQSIGEFCRAWDTDKASCYSSSQCHWHKNACVPDAIGARKVQRKQAMRGWTYFLAFFAIGLAVVAFALAQLGIDIASVGMVGSVNVGTALLVLLAGFGVLRMPRKCDYSLGCFFLGGSAGREEQNTNDMRVRKEREAIVTSRVLRESGFMELAHRGVLGETPVSVHYPQLPTGHVRSQGRSFGSKGQRHRSWSQWARGDGGVGRRGVANRHGTRRASRVWVRGSPPPTSTLLGGGATAETDARARNRPRRGTARARVGCGATTVRGGLRRTCRACTVWRPPPRSRHGGHDTHWHTGSPPPLPQGSKIT